MKHFLGITALVGTLLGFAGSAVGQDPSFALSVDAPVEIRQPAGTAITYDAMVQLTTMGLLETDPGAQGWSLSVGAEGGALVDATITGTAGEAALTGGFTSTEMTTGAGNEGVVSAVVLSFKKPVTLPPSGTADILRLEVGATVPQPGVDLDGDPVCNPLDSRVFLVNGRQGSGQPVDNKITYLGETILPTLSGATTRICPRIVRPLNFRVSFASPEAETADAGAVVAEYEAQVPLNPGVVPVVAETLLDSNLEGATAGAQGWSVSVATEPCFGVQSATTTGTAGEPGQTGGFESTEVVNPDRNGGAQGVVSAVVLSFKKPITLPTVGTSLVLEIVGQIDASGVTGPGAATAPCQVRVLGPDEQGLVGSGEPVQTAVTVGGETKKPGAAGATLKLVGMTEALFIRGNANDDGKKDLADAIWIINELYRGGTPTRCEDAADANDDGLVDSTDAVYLVSHFFLSGSSPPPPFESCGTDPTADMLECSESQESCQ